MSFAPSLLVVSLSAMTLLGCSSKAQSPLTAGSAGVSQGSVPRRTLSAAGLPTIGNPGQPRPAGAPGDLTVLNWAGHRGAVTYTFDDANSSQIEHYAELQALGVPMTFFLQTGKPEAASKVWTQAAADGHELANHSRSHAQEATAEDIDAASLFIKEKHGVTAWTMASPYGNNSYVPFAATRFLVNRGVVNAVIAPNSEADPFNLPSFVPPAEAPAAVFNEQIDSARSAGGWRILLLHGFTGGSDGAYQAVKIGDFIESVKHAQSLGDLWLDSFVNIGAYWRAQKLLATTVPTTSGQDRVWTWTLPAHFPPGKFLRVTVGGGTLSQKGQPLAWDEHGYYEVSLDAGSLTLTP